MSKYHSERTNGYASRKEARFAADLAILARAGKILDLREQVAFTLIEGRNGVQGIKYIADFCWKDADTGVAHVADVKGYRTPVYRLKKKMMYLLCGLTIEEL
jgi:hypothetical protein